MGELESVYRLETNRKADFTQGMNKDRYNVEPA